ncbi:MAG: hypothetical protein IJX44_04580 [Bacteroidaceae bacterium]|nr:hypothetical protein [Bacteroidaceae bacterium]
MKKIFFTLLTLCISCSVFAQNGSELDLLPTNGNFNISNEGVLLDSKNQIVYNSSKDTVYIAFGKSNFVKLKANVASSINRGSVNDRIKTNSKIFVQIGGGYQGKDYITENAGYLVDGIKGGTQKDAYVIIKKSDLPLNIVVDSKVIHVLEFMSSDLSHCETIRSGVAAYQKLPDCEKDTITINQIKDYKYPAFELKFSNAWKKSTIKYYINDQECEVINGYICLPSELATSIKKGDKLVISYNIECKHDYFGHIREGDLVEVYIETSTTSSYWWYLLLVPIIGVIIWSILYRRKQKINKNKGDEDRDLNSNDGANDDVMEDIEETVTKITPDVKSNDVRAIDDVLNSIMPNINELATQEKIDLIKEKIESSEKMSDDLLMFYQELDLSDNSTTGDFLNELKKLKQNFDEQEKKLEKCQCPEDIYAQVISLLLNKDSKILSSLVDKAKQESTGVSRTNYDIVKRFINILPMSLKEAVKSNPAVQTVDLDITEQQMGTAANRRKMMVWMIEQLEARGYKELNRNGSTDENFEKLSQTLLSVSEIEEKPSVEEIINVAVNNDQFTLEQKNILLKRIIEQINSQINDETAVINTSISIDDFISMVSEKIQLPNSYEEAQEIIRGNNLKLINEVLESSIDDLTQQSLEEALRSAIVKLLSRHLKGLNAENLKDVINELSISLTNSTILTKTLNEYNINTISELPMIIRQKMSEEIIASVNHKVNQFFPDRHFDSVQKLVNALLKLSEDIKDNEALIADELEEKISMRNNSYVSSGQCNIIKLLNDYNDLVTTHEEQLNTEIRGKAEHITRLESKVEQKLEEVNVLTQKNTILMIESGKMLEILRNCAESISDSCKTILNPCSDSDESQCVDIEDRLFADLLNSTNRIKALSISNESIPVDTRKAIQQFLIQELIVENSPINTVCRYYAYSRLPFMTDTSREYGIIFNRKNMSELFHAVETLYVQFGINLSIPDLFVAGFEEGNFENLTGQTYGDLDNLCQNSRNHFDNIDSKVKPSNVIVDVINVGYAVDGKVERITSVLTY